MNSKPKIPDSAGTSYTNIICIKLSAFLQGKSPDYEWKYVLNRLITLKYKQEKIIKKIHNRNKTVTIKW
jgi:hypothetical protein